MFYLEGRGDSSPHLSTAAPVLCSQQPNRTDTLSPCMKPLWGRTRDNILCMTLCVSACVVKLVCVCVSSGAASGLWCVGSLWAQSVCVLEREIMQANVRAGIYHIALHPRVTWVK